jgi:hypothetical protein
VRPVPFLSVIYIIKSDNLPSGELTLCGRFIVQEIAPYIAAKIAGALTVRQHISKKKNLARFFGGVFLLKYSVVF